MQRLLTGEDLIRVSFDLIELVEFLLEGSIGRRSDLRCPLLVLSSSIVREWKRVVEHVRSLCCPWMTSERGDESETSRHWSTCWSSVADVVERNQDWSIDGGTRDRRSVIVVELC